MFDEDKKAKLENQALNLASQVLLSLRREKAMESRASMMRILNRLSDEFSSSRLWSNDKIKKAVALGFDERFKEMVIRLKSCVDDAIIEMDGGDMPDLSKMKKLDKAMMDLLDRRS